MRPNVGQGRDPKPQEGAVLGQGQLGQGLVIAAVGVGQEGFGALGHPLDRAIELLGRPEGDDFVTVDVDLGAEAAADVRCHHAQLVLGPKAHEGRQHQARHMGILACAVEGQAVTGIVVLADGGAGFDGIGDQAVVDDLQLGDVVGLGEGFICGCLVADLPVEAEVAGNIGVQLVRTLGQGIGHLCEGRQVLEIHLDQLGRVFGLGQGLGHHHGQLFADEGDTISRQGRDGRRFVRLAVLLGDDPAADRTADAVGCEVCCREDADDARRRLGVAAVDAVDLGMGDGRVEEVGVGLARDD